MRSSIECATLCVIDFEEAVRRCLLARSGWTRFFCLPYPTLLPDLTFKPTYDRPYLNIILRLCGSTALAHPPDGRHVQGSEEREECDQGCVEHATRTASNWQTDVRATGYTSAQVKVRNGT